MRRHLTLRGRITLVTIAVATLAVLVTGLVSLQLVRQSTIDQARSQLAAQAVLLSKARITGVEALSERVQLALGAAEVGVVSASGVASGPAAELLRPIQLRRLVNGGKVSAVVASASGAMIVEARQARGGGAVVLALPRDTVDQDARAALVRIGLALLIGLAVAAVAGALLARWIARPLVGAADTARRMAAGERGIRVPLEAPAEVAAVGHALAALDVALTSSEGRQREFLLSISHELRTPLTALRGYAEALADGMVPPGDVAAVGRTLVGETERLDRFVADLLELARLEADDFSITPEPVDLGALIDASVQAWRGRASALGVELSAAAEPLVITTDPRRVRQIVDGLVENALRVTPEGAAIEIRVTRVREGARIEVRDGGPGISDADAAVAFQRGVLRERYRASRPVGTGLGLSIAARLAARLGGSIRAGSAAEGGAVFTVTLPT